MTKEKTLKEVCGYGSDDLFEDNDDITISEALEAMQKYADQQTAEKDKRIKELTESLSRLVFLHECEQEGLSSGQPTPEMWFEAVNKASEVLTKINQTNVK